MQSFKDDAKSTSKKAKAIGFFNFLSEVEKKPGKNSQTEISPCLVIFFLTFQSFYSFHQFFFLHEIVVNLLLLKEF